MKAKNANNIKYFALLVAMHAAVIAICMAVMILQNINWYADLNKTIFQVRYATAMGSAFLVYGLWRSKCSPFVLPLSFLPLPFLVLFLLKAAGLFFDEGSGVFFSAFDAIIDALFFCIPCAVLTLISSIIAKEMKDERVRAVIKFFALLVAMHTVVFAIYMAVMEHLNIMWFENTILIIARYAVAIGSACLVYGVWRHKCSPFVLPVSFFSLPIIFMLLLAVSRMVINVSSDPEGWEIFAVIDAVSFSGPCAVLSLISSIIVDLIKKKGARP